MPADILRDREGGDATESGDLRPAPATTPGAGVPYFLQRPGFADLTDSLTDQLAAKRREIDAARAERAKAVEAEGAALQRRADAMRPPIEAARTALEAPRPAPPVPPGLAPAPSRKLTDFLAPVAGESPENTITKLIQGIGLMAAGITGLKHGDARAALAGLRGALAGWQEGDKQRADRAFADWESASKSLIGDWERRHKVYRDLLEDQKLTVDQKLEAVKLKALEEGHQVAVETFNRQRVDDALAWLREDELALEKMREGRERLQMQLEAKRQHDETIREMKAQTLAIQKDKQANVLDQYDDAAIEALAWKAIHDGGRVPSVGYGQAGQVVRGRVMKKVAEIAKANGIPLQSLPGIGDEMKGAQTEINTASRQLAYWNANIDTFHKHVKQFLELSENTPRGQAPVANRYQLKLQGKYQGDAQVAAYEAMANEIAMEYAKLSVGTAQGDQNSRAEARELINGALNVEQIRAVMEQLLKAGENRKQSWSDAVKRGAESVATFGGRVAMPLPPGSKATPPPDLVWDETTKKLMPRVR